MAAPATVAELTELGRVQLSEHFFMRDMLYSEVANLHGMPNIPDDPDLAIAAGRALCQTLLEPLHRAFGGLAVRSAYRSSSLNAFAHERLLAGERAYYCGSNDYSAGRHIWDRRDAQGFMGATASVIVPWYLPRFEASGDYRQLAWWIRDHVPEYAELCFFPWLCAFNIRWYEGPADRAVRYDDGTPAENVILTREGMDNFDGDHSPLYPGFPEGAP